MPKTTTYTDGLIRAVTEDRRLEMGAVQSVTLAGKQHWLLCIDGIDIHTDRAEIRYMYGIHGVAIDSVTVHRNPDDPSEVLYRIRGLCAAMSLAMPDDYAEATVIDTGNLLREIRTLAADKEAMGETIKGLKAQLDNKNKQIGALSELIHRIEKLADLFEGGNGLSPLEVLEQEIPALHDKFQDALESANGEYDAAEAWRRWAVKQVGGVSTRDSVSDERLRETLKHTIANEGMQQRLANKACAELETCRALNDELRKKLLQAQEEIRKKRDRWARWLKKSLNERGHLQRKLIAARAKTGELREVNQRIDRMSGHLVRVLDKLFPELAGLWDLEPVEKAIGTVGGKPRTDPRMRHEVVTEGATSPVGCSLRGVESVTVLANSSSSHAKPPLSQWEKRLAETMTGREERIVEQDGVYYRHVTETINPNPRVIDPDQHETGLVVRSNKKCEHSDG